MAKAISDGCVKKTTFLDLGETQSQGDKVLADASSGGESKETDWGAEFLFQSAICLAKISFHFSR